MLKYTFPFLEQPGLLHTAPQEGAGVEAKASGDGALG